MRNPMAAAKNAIKGPAKTKTKTKPKVKTGSSVTVTDRSHHVPAAIKTKAAPKATPTYTVGTGGGAPPGDPATSKTTMTGPPKDAYSKYANADMVRAAMQAKYGDLEAGLQGQIRQGVEHGTSIDNVFGNYQQALEMNRQALIDRQKAAQDQVAAAATDSLGQVTAGLPGLDAGVQALIGGAAGGASKQTALDQSLMASKRTGDEGAFQGLGAAGEQLRQQLQSERAGYVSGKQDELAKLGSDRGAAAFTLDKELSDAARDYADSRSDVAKEQELAVNSLLGDNAKTKAQYDAAIKQIEFNKYKLGVTDENVDADRGARVSIADKNRAAADARATQADKTKRDIAHWRNSTTLEAAQTTSSGKKGTTSYKNYDGSTIDLSAADQKTWRNQKGTYGAVMEDALNAMQGPAQGDAKGGTREERAMYHLKRSYSGVPTQVLRAAIYASKNGGKVDGRYAKILAGWFKGGLVPQGLAGG